MNFLKKVTLSITLTCISFTASAADYPIQAVDQVNLQKYLGQWHEVARKPLIFQKDCAYQVVAKYSLNSNGNIEVNNSCYKANAEKKQSIGEAFVQNSPKNSQLKVSFLPQFLRWIPIARGDYWVLKIDPEYKMALVGAPNKKYLWVLSRDPQPPKQQVQQYLDYAKSLGYELNDVIYTPYKP